MNGARETMQSARTRRATISTETPEMIGKLNHVAIAVPDLAAATAIYRDTLGASVTEPAAQLDLLAALSERWLPARQAA